MLLAALATVDTVIIVGFLVIVTIVGYVMSKAASRGLDDYFLGGNKIPWWVLGISTSTSNFDMAGTMVIVSVVFSLGYKGFLVELRGGVGLSLALLLVFLAKWLRRSRVMTSAEWMKLRFGTDKQGRAAHLFSALANILLSVGMIVYFCKGAGAFLVHFMPFSELTCTTGMVLIGLFYTLMSGLYGVVFTDVVQMILLSITAIYISVMAFGMAGDMTLPAGFLALDLENPTGAGKTALMAKDAAYWGPVFSGFGIAVMFWLFRTMLEGAGGVGGYTDQRFFAARSEREASLLTLEAIILSLMRWTMVAGLVVLAFHLVEKGGQASADILANSESVLPIVVSEMLPAGIKGLVIAGLIAAAMSTFDSTLNAGASYIVKDVYESYINPTATGEQLMRVSRWATVGLCVSGVLLAAIVPNINAIWDLITMALGPALFVPLALRWYWPRFNGYGFALGTGGGVAVAIVVNMLGWPMHQAFPTITLAGLITCIVVSLMTAEVPKSVLNRFYLQINPWGFWRETSKRLLASGDLSNDEAGERLWEKLNDGIAICLSVPFQVCLLLGGMAFIFHDWRKFSFFAIVTALTGVGLYFFWFKNLKSAEQCKEEDQIWAGVPLGLPAESSSSAADTSVTKTGS